MGLEPLEFSECLTDSPFFRDKLHIHEKELDRTSKAIKQLINECKELVSAAAQLSKAQRTFAKTLTNFQFECIENQKTDDEVIIEKSFSEFGKMLSSVEDARDRMLQRANKAVIEPLEKFRKEQIGEAKEGKRKFEKQTSKFYQSQERYLNVKQNKASETQLQESDAALHMERRHFFQESMKYVLLLQEVQERKKFEFVEILLQFMLGWGTFYHEGYEVSEDYTPFMSDLSHQLQKCRGNFDVLQEEAVTLMNKMSEKPQDNAATLARTVTREGYLFVLEKKALGTTWAKYYCQYKKDSKSFAMIAYSQVAGKGASALTKENYAVTSCVRRQTDSIDKRFCFDISVQERPQPFTVQATCEDDRRLWLDVMDGKEPIYTEPVGGARLDSLLDDIGFCCIKKCITAIEAKGLEEEGLYRVVGVNSKVSKLTNMLLDRRKANRVDFDEVDSEWEMKTITSALKNYFRSLPEPLMTFKLHQKLIHAAKQESKTLRINDIHELIHQLPEPNFEMLDVLIAHLKKVSESSAKNLMTVGNLGVCFGPTLMRPEEETVAAIMDIKFCNLIVEILIENYTKIFKTAPEFADVANSRVLNSKPPVTSASQVRPQRGSAPPPPPPGSQVNLSGAMSVSGSTVVDSSSSQDSASPYPNNSMALSALINSVNSSSSVYQSPLPPDAGGTAYNQTRAKLRPTTTIGSMGQFLPDHPSSASSSSESINFRCSNSSMSTSHSGADILGPVRTRRGGSQASSWTAGDMAPIEPRRKVRTLYSCTAENEAELSFEPNQIITNVHPSKEPGWFEGTLNGKMGLIPHNYVEFLD